MFAAAIGISNSPAITIANSSDVGAQGPRTDSVVSLVAINGSIAFCAVALLQPQLEAGGPVESWVATWAAAAETTLSLALGGTLAWIAVMGARWLGGQAEHEPLLILGLIFTAVGIGTSLDMSALLALLSAISLMQLVGSIATQCLIRGFGEARTAALGRGPKEVGAA